MQVRGHFHLPLSGPNTPQGCSVAELAHGCFLFCSTMPKRPQQLSSSASWTKQHSRHSSRTAMHWLLLMQPTHRHGARLDCLQSHYSLRQTCLCLQDLSCSTLLLSYNSRAHCSSKRFCSPQQCLSIVTRSQTRITSRPQTTSRCVCGMQLQLLLRYSSAIIVHSVVCCWASGPDLAVVCRLALCQLRQQGPPHM